MSKRRLKNRKLLTEINVIPYVDISLVLLVIFMVATPFMIQGIDLDLPKTEAQALNKSKDDNLTISISKEGFYSLDLGEKNEIYKSFQSFTEQFEKIQDFFMDVPRVKYKINFVCKKCGHENERELVGIQDFFG